MFPGKVENGFAVEAQVSHVAADAPRQCIKIFGIRMIICQRMQQRIQRRRHVRFVFLREIGNSVDTDAKCARELPRCIVHITLVRESELDATNKARVERLMARARSWNKASIHRLRCCVRPSGKTNVRFHRSKQEERVSARRRAGAL